MGFIMGWGRFVKMPTQWRWAHGILLLSLGSVVAGSLPAAGGQRLRHQAVESKAPWVQQAQHTGLDTGTSGVSLENNRLSINVQNRDLQELLRELAARGDIEVRHLDSLPSKTISLRLANVSMVEGLKRLFRAAEIDSYVLITGNQGDAIRVQRIVFFPADDLPGSPTPRASIASSPALAPSPSAPRTEASREDVPESGSVFQDLQSNTAARRLLSQLVHPNEQVRERALERLVRLVDTDDKQAELLEFLEPLMEKMASEDQIEREEARQEIRNLLRR